MGSFSLLYAYGNCVYVLRYYITVVMQFIAIKFMAMLKDMFLSKNIYN